MIEFKQFRPRDVRRIVGIQGEQAEDYVFAMGLDEAAGLAEHAAWTGFEGDDVIGCAGIVPVWAGRSCVWALLGERCGPYMLPITKFVSGQIARCPDKRIEATVLTGFGAGEKWMKLLGFTLETPNGMRSYDPAGRTISLYSRIRS